MALHAARRQAYGSACSKEAGIWLCMQQGGRHMALHAARRQAYGSACSKEQTYTWKESVLMYALTYVRTR